MPVRECQENDKPGYKWGEQGKCYTYNPNNEGQRRKAKQYATIQGYAVGDFAGLRISFDYDDTLSTRRGKEIAQKEIDKGNVLYVISARNDKTGMLSTALSLGIPQSRVFATGSNKAKVEKIQELRISKHYDNNKNVIKDLNQKTKVDGVIFFSEFEEGDITCEKCGWSWNISDGGNDPYICHKCGYDNQKKQK